MVRGPETLARSITTSVFTPPLVMETVKLSDAETRSSRPGVSIGTMKAEMPRWPFARSVFANTTVQSA